MEVEILNAKSSQVVTRCQFTDSTTIADVKKNVAQNAKKPIHIDRQSIRLEQRGKSLDDKVTLKSLGLGKGAKLYVKDLGPQIGWSTVFLLEYAGPLVCYLWLYQRPWLFYGNTSNAPPMSLTAHMAAAFWSIHYAKRILETLFVHRFSHATMPLFNLFKNCTYYWAFTIYVAYHINHPLYTSPAMPIVLIGAIGFIVCELGNFSIHMALRNLRPPGSTVRAIPTASSNVFTILFDFVSCPNYTYEIGSWIFYTIMTSCLPAGIFALAGAYQMTIWALGKHRNYKKGFSNYPKQRKAIFPFVI